MDINFLKKVALVKELDQKELELFASKLKLEKFKKNELIIEEEKASDKMFILYEGEVGITKRISMIDEQEKISKTFTSLRGEDHVFFGEIGILGMQKRTATCCARTDCTLYSIDHKNFIDICQKNPVIGYKILLEISRRLSGLVEKTNRDVLKLTTALIYALKN